MHKRLYEYVLIKQELRDKDDQVTDEATVLGRGEVLASSEDQVGIHAAREISEEEMANLDRIEVAIRPF